MCWFGVSGWVARCLGCLGQGLGCGMGLVGIVCCINCWGLWLIFWRSFGWLRGVSWPGGAACTSLWWCWPFRSYGALKAQKLLTSIFCQQFSAVLRLRGSWAACVQLSYHSDQKQNQQLLLYATQCLFYTICYLSVLYYLLYYLLFVYLYILINKPKVICQEYYIGALKHGRRQKKKQEEVLCSCYKRWDQYFRSLGWLSNFHERKEGKAERIHW